MKSCINVGKNSKKVCDFVYSYSPTNWNLFDYLLQTMIYALSVSKTFETFIDDAYIREIMLSGVSGYILTLRVPISMYSL